VKILLGSILLDFAPAAAPDFFSWELGWVFVAFPPFGKGMLENPLHWERSDEERN